MADWRPELAVLAGIQVLDLDGRLIELASLWRGRCAVVAFLRHFGCSLCRAQAAELGGLCGDLARRGAGLVAIGSGTHLQARYFVDAFGFPGELYVDPKREAFQALGLHRGVLRALGPRALGCAAAARRAGFSRGALAGDPWQQGGTLVVGPGDRLHFAHRDRWSGDRARPDEILRSLPT